MRAAEAGTWYGEGAGREVDKSTAEDCIDHAITHAVDLTIYRKAV